MPRHKGQREHDLRLFAKAHALDLSARSSPRGWPQKPLSSEEAVLSLPPSPPLSQGSPVVPRTLTLLPAAFLEQRFPALVLLGPLERAPGRVPASQARLLEGCWLRRSPGFYGLSFCLYNLKTVLP